MWKRPLRPCLGVGFRHWELTKEKHLVTLVTLFLQQQRLLLFKEEENKRWIASATFLSAKCSKEEPFYFCIRLLVHSVQLPQCVVSEII